MNPYIETKYFFYRTTITFTESDTLILKKKSPLLYTQEAIPLRVFAPETKLISGGLSYLARCLLWLELMCIVGFFVTLFSTPEYLADINIPICLMIICFCLLASVFYYLSVTQKRVFFYYQNETPSFMLKHIKNNQEQLNFIKQFKAAVIQARVNFEEYNFARIKRGVDNLQNQKIISEHFCEELHYRISSIANTKIK
jgi:hypothetical protein